MLSPPTTTLRTMGESDVHCAMCHRHLKVLYKADDYRVPTPYCCHCTRAILVNVSANAMTKSSDFFFQMLYADGEFEFPSAMLYI